MLILCDPMDCPWNSPGQNTGVGSLSLLQGIFLTQGSNRGLLHCRRIICQLSYQGSPKSQRPPPKVIKLFSVSSVQSLSCVQLFATPWTAAHQASLSITNSQGFFRLMSIESVMPSNHLVLCRPFSSCPQSFPASRSFLMSQFFPSGGQSIGVSASASVLPMNIQDCIYLGYNR